ncbi:hypothetical protein [Actinosynnema sp. ALI-1.44]|uniref:hypothetical protein n=1 Tax=Actinosynnema sp. ALI-1.44 TaxID=1933779 RepID=UPI00192CFCB9|nr:hypothetical protein [Actinosynnema sp. ALI-1.44]
MLRTIRTGSARDLSWAWILMMCAGVGAGLVYGLLGTDLPVIVANGVTLVLIAALGVVEALQERVVVTD